MKSIILAVLLSLTSVANAAVITVLGYNIDDAETNVFSGEYVIYDTGWPDEPGALDYNTVNGSLIHQCCGAGSNYADADVLGWMLVESGPITQNPTTISFESYQDQSASGTNTGGGTDEYLGLLMEGTLTYISGDDYQFDITGGALAAYFDGGILNYDDTIVGGKFTDTNFTLTMDATPSAVPVPAAVWLFGSGLLGMISIARRRK